MYYEQSYEKKKEIFGAESLEAYETLLNIAVLHDELGYHTKAISYYNEIIEALKLAMNTKNSIYAEC